MNAAKCYRPFVILVKLILNLEIVGAIKIKYIVILIKMKIKNAYNVSMKGVIMIKIINLKKNNSYHH